MEKHSGFKLIILIIIIVSGSCARSIDNSTSGENHTNQNIEFRSRMNTDIAFITTKSQTIDTNQLDATVIKNHRKERIEKMQKQFGNQKLNVNEFVVNEDDARQEFESIFKTHHNIYVDSGLYHVDPVPGDNILIQDNSVIAFDSNAVIEIKPNNLGDYDNKYYLFTINNASNVVIDGMKIRGDKHTHLGDKKGEWAAGLTVRGKSNNINLINIDISEMWGDGLIISASLRKVKDGGFTAPSNIILNNFSIRDVGRNGISVTGGANIIIKNGRANGANRTAPGAGIDIEPALYRPVSDVVIENVELDSNWHGIIGYAHTSNILYKDLSVHNNRRNGMIIRQIDGPHTVKNCVIKNNGNLGLFIYRTEFPVYVDSVSISDTGVEGILIKETVGQVYLENIKLKNSRNYSASIKDSENVSLVNVSAKNAKYFGLLIENSKNILLDNSSFSEHQRGVAIRGDSDDIIVKKSRIFNNSIYNINVARLTNEQANIKIEDSEIFGSKVGMTSRQHLILRNNKMHSNDKDMNQEVRKN